MGGGGGGGHCSSHREGKTGSFPLSCLAPNEEMRLVAISASQTVPHLGRSRPTSLSRDRISGTTSCPAWLLIMGSLLRPAGPSISLFGFRETLLLFVDHSFGVTRAAPPISAASLIVRLFVSSQSAEVLAGNLTFA